MASSFRESLRIKLSLYRFEIKHILVFFSVLIVFQIALAYLQTVLLDEFLADTQQWFQKYYVERLASVTSSSLELLFEEQSRTGTRASIEFSRIYSINVLLQQQRIQRSVEDICLFLEREGQVFLVDNGQELIDFFRERLPPGSDPEDSVHTAGWNYFQAVHDELRSHESVLSVVTGQRTFDVLVPFVPEGEYVGAMYMRVTPDFTFLTDEVQVNFAKVSLILSTLVVTGLILMYAISSRAVTERNDAQQRLYVEHKENLARQIQLEKESLFTKRIYHTHHKAEKIMGFIKDDVRNINSGNLPEMQRRVITYSNFMLRILYDMKWYDQDINTIVNPVFRSSVNDVIKFVVEHVFLRLSRRNEMFRFTLDLDGTIPPVPVNEYIIWEILEPLVQNSIDHGDKETLIITIRTRHEADAHRSTVAIEDTGRGFPDDLLRMDGDGIQQLFREKQEATDPSRPHSGYGCYIAHQMAVGKCGWGMTADNIPGGGARITIMIRYGGRV